MAERYVDTTLLAIVSTQANTVRQNGSRTLFVLCFSSGISHGGIFYIIILPYLLVLDYENYMDNFDYLGQF